MSAFVELRAPSGETFIVGPGAIVGRSFAADVKLDDGRVSEAHALVSLRGGEWVLFALRGRLRVGGRDVPRVVLQPGLDIELAAGVSLIVGRVRLPATVLALEGQGVPRQVLTGVVSICVQPQLHVVSGVHPSAETIVFSDGLHWFARGKTGAPRRLRAGEALTSSAGPLQIVELELAAAETPETGPVESTARLKIVSQGPTVQIWRSTEATPCVLSGQPAVLLSSLLAHGGPLRWERAAQTLWEEEEADEVVRHRLDVVLGKLRRRLEDAGVRRDLVTSHHNGYLELVLYPGDQAHDRQP